MHYGFLWKKTVQLVSGKVEFNACQVSLLWHNSDSQPLICSANPRTFLSCLIGMVHAWLKCNNGMVNDTGQNYATIVRHGNFETSWSQQPSGTSIIMLYNSCLHFVTSMHF